MDDARILALFWERSEVAITETAWKYGKYCRKIAVNILQNREDSEECVSDTYRHTVAADCFACAACTFMT